MFVITEVSMNNTILISGEREGGVRGNISLQVSLDGSSVLGGTSLLSLDGSSVLGGTSLLSLGGSSVLGGTSLLSLDGSSV